MTENNRPEISPHVVSTLQMEYNEIRQATRDLVNSMDTNFNIAISMIAGIFAFSKYVKAPEWLYLIPSLIFMSTIIHLLKTSAASVHGTYCQVIETRLKKVIDSDLVLLDWENGIFSECIASPTGIVQIGFYIFFLAVTALYWTMAVEAYYWQNWTIYLHVTEFLIAATYAFFCVRWNTKTHRKRIIEKYSL
jgi:hypothetical protein